jgi:hypothetical protein
MKSARSEGVRCVRREERGKERGGEGIVRRRESREKRERKVKPDEHCPI